MAKPKDDVSQLIAAWEDWERVAGDAPKNPSTLWLAAQSYKKESAIKKFNVSARLLHSAISEGRKAGLSVEESVKSALHEMQVKDQDETLQDK